MGRKDRTGGLGADGGVGDGIRIFWQEKSS